MLLVLLLACRSDDDGTALRHAEDCGTWTSVGQPLLLASCTSCHSSGLVGAARFGAPEGVDLDTLAGAMSWSEAIIDRVEAGTMPPSGALDAADADALVAWLQCGAPGEDAGFPDGLAPAGLVAASETRERVLVDEAYADGLTLRTTLFGGELNGQERWSEERYVVSDDRGWLAGRTLYEADGSEALVEDWDPPLLLYHGDETSWSENYLVSRSSPGLVETREETWIITVGQDWEADARQTDPDATTARATLDGEPPDGPATLEMGVAFAADLSLSRRWRSAQDGLGQTTLEDHLQLTVAYPFEDLPEFPLEDGVEWMGRVLVSEGGAP